MAVTFTATTVTNPTGAQGSYPLREVAGHEGMLLTCRPTSAAAIATNPAPPSLMACWLQPTTAPPATTP